MGALPARWHQLIVVKARASWREKTHPPLTGATEGMVRTHRVVPYTRLRRESQRDGNTP